jgi:hypothetical protein
MEMIWFENVIQCLFLLLFWWAQDIGNVEKPIEEKALFMFI